MAAVKVINQLDVFESVRSERRRPLALSLTALSENQGQTALCHFRCLAGISTIILSTVQLLSVRKVFISSHSQGQHCPKIMKPPRSLPLQMAERLLRAQPDSTANHVTDRSISDRRAST